METHRENIQEGGTMKDKRRRLERVNAQHKETVKEREWKTEGKTFNKTLDERALTE